jgi:hypothetical protein
MNDMPGDCTCLFWTKLHRAERAIKPPAGDSHRRLRASLYGRFVSCHGFVGGNRFSPAPANPWMSSWLSFGHALLPFCFARPCNSARQFRSAGHRHFLCGRPSFPSRVFRNRVPAGIHAHPARRGNVDSLLTGAMDMTNRVLLLDSWTRIRKQEYFNNSSP